MERRKLELLLIHHGDAKRNLHENRELSDASIPPQRTCSKRREFVCGERPDASEAITDNGDPRPGLV